jgi:hypothetical protein
LSDDNIYTWKCYKKTPCVAILNKQKYNFFSFFFYKIREQEGETGPAWVRGLVTVGGGKRLGKSVGG